jgi:hypothetical protein
VSARHLRPRSLALAALVLGACGGEGRQTTSQPPDPDLLLSLDGGRIQVRAAEAAPFLEYLDGLDPTMGRNYRLRELLDQHLLPLALARAAFGPERQALRERAEALRAVADNSLELRRKGELVGGLEPAEPLSRNDLPLPVAAWAFRPENLGAVSPPLETPQGFVLIAPLDLEPGLTAVTDQLRAFVVRFEHQDRDSFDAWLGRARQGLVGRIDHVAPTCRAALPLWLTP